MTTENISFTNCRQQKLSGVVHGEICDRAVVVCHGMLSDKGSPKHTSIAEGIAKLGITSLRFDFCGRGESEGELFDLSYSNEIEDLSAAMEYLRQRGVKQFGLFGSSMGGGVVLLSAARHDDVQAVATLAAVAHVDQLARRHSQDLHDWQQRGYFKTAQGKISSAFFEDAAKHDVLSSVSQITAPTLVIHGDQDEIVPHTDGIDIASATTNAILNMVTGADHRFSNPQHLDPAIDEIVAFFGAELQPSES